MNFLSHIGDFMFPRTCHICGLGLSGSEKYVCTSCLSRLPRTNWHRLPDNGTEQRFLGLFPFRQATGHFFYSRDSDLSVLMHDLKYHGFRGLARYLGGVVATELLTTGFMTGIDALVPVPMHFMKKARRGYNQTEEIARGISKVTGNPGRECSSCSQTPPHADVDDARRASAKHIRDFQTCRSRRYCRKRDIDCR